MEAMGRVVISMMTVYIYKQIIYIKNMYQSKPSSTYKWIQSNSIINILEYIKLILNLHQLNNKNSAVLRLRMCFLPFELISSNEVRVFRVDGSNEVVNAQLVQLPLDQLGKTDISHVMVDSWRNSFEKCWNNVYIYLKKKERKDIRDIFNSESLACKFY